jgi:hypothetical protein
MQCNDATYEKIKSVRYVTLTAVWNPKTVCDMTEKV